MGRTARSVCARDRLVAYAPILMKEACSVFLGHWSLGSAGRKGEKHNVLLGLSAASPPLAC